MSDSEGAAAMPEKNIRLSILVNPETLQAIEDHAAATCNGNRAEALRRLLSLGKFTHDYLHGGGIIRLEKDGKIQKLVLK